MVKCGGKGLRRITSLYAEGTIVYGTVRSQSGISEWCFKIDFNDYGSLTGTYWLSTDNNDSSIPKIVANRIAQQINEYPDRLDDSFKDALSYTEAQKRARAQIAHTVVNKIITRMQSSVYIVAGVFGSNLCEAYKHGHFRKDGYKGCRQENRAYCHISCCERSGKIALHRCSC